MAGRVRIVFHAPQCAIGLHSESSMSVVIRMKRTGRRNRPCYRISVADRALPRDGRTLENLGVYDPVSPLPEMRLKLDVERAREWVKNGALPSDTVRSIFKREGVYEGFEPPKKRKRPGRSKPTAKKTRRQQEDDARLEAKKARRSGRLALKREAAKAAKAAAGGGEES